MTPEWSMWATMTPLTSVTISQLALGICLHFRIPYNTDQKTGACGHQGTSAYPALSPQACGDVTHQNVPVPALASAAHRALGGKG